MTTKKTMDRLLGEMRRASDLVQERRPGEAMEVYRALVVEVRQVGLDSAHMHHLATRQPEQARVLVDAVTLLHPASREAWEAKAKLAADTGDTVAAERARIEAAALSDGEPAFGIPGPASA